jgi:CBS domain containing-hemolysin-like protein
LEPPQPQPWLGLLLIAVAALFATAASTVTSISHARLGALQETTTGFRARALERYLKHGAFIRARWRALRALGVAAGTVLVLQATSDVWLTLGLVFGSFFLLAQLGAAGLKAVAEGATPWLLVLVRPIELLVIPLCDPIVLATNWVGGSINTSTPDSELTETEVEHVVNQGEQSGALDHDQSAMLRNVLEFGDREASDLMVPRPQMEAIDVASSPEQIMAQITEQGHTRYPVYRDSIEEIVGILHVKDVFLFAASKPLKKLDISKLLRKAVFVPETQRASSVLEQMRAGRHHMSIVLDEFGGVAGLLTLEDLLEEIVGEIQDEHDDDDESPISQLGDGRFIVDASIPIAELNRQVGLELPDGEEYNSLGGYIVEVMGKVPTVGTVLEQAGHRLVVRGADERHVAKVEIGPLQNLRVSA